MTISDSPFLTLQNATDRPPPNRGSAAQADLLGGSVRRPTHQRRQSAEANNISLGSTPRSVRQNVLADREAL